MYTSSDINSIAWVIMLAPKSKILSKTVVLPVYWSILLLVFHHSFQLVLASDSDLGKLLDRSRALLHSFPHGDPLRYDETEKCRTAAIGKELTDINDALLSLGPQAIPKMIAYRHRPDFTELQGSLLDDVLIQYKPEMIELLIQEIKERAARKQQMNQDPRKNYFPIPWDKPSFLKLLPLAQNSNPLVKRNAEQCLLQMIARARHVQGENNLVEFYSCGQDCLSARIPVQVALELLELTPLERQEPLGVEMRANSIFALGMVEPTSQKVVDLLLQEIGSNDMFSAKEEAAVALGRIVLADSLNSRTISPSTIEKIVSRLRTLSKHPYHSHAILGAQIGLCFIAVARPEYRDDALNLLQNGRFTPFIDNAVQCLKKVDSAKAEPYLQILRKKRCSSALSSLGPKFAEKTVPLLLEIMSSSPTEAPAIALMELGKSVEKSKHILKEYSAEHAGPRALAAKAVLARLDFADCRGTNTSSSKNCKTRLSPDYLLFEAKFKEIAKPGEAEAGELYRQAILKYKSGNFDRTLMQDAVVNYAQLLKREKQVSQAEAMLAEFKSKGNLSRVPRSQFDRKWSGYY